MADRDTDTRQLHTLKGRVRPKRDQIRAPWDSFTQFFADYMFWNPPHVKDAPQRRHPISNTVRSSPVFKILFVYQAQLQSVRVPEALYE